MSEAGRMTIKIDIGQPDRPGPKKIVTLKSIIEWIKRKQLDSYTQNYLIEVASRYPTAALPFFGKNFNIMLQRARAQRWKDQSETIESPTEIFEEEKKPARIVEKEPYQPTRRPLFDESENSNESNYEPVQDPNWEPKDEHFEETETTVTEISPENNVE